jgi:FkbM family methyltransferase
VIEIEMRNQIRNLARRFLPASIRKPLGTAAGKFDELVIRQTQGLLFDLSGGKFHLAGCTFHIPKDQTSLAYRSSFLSGKYEVEDIEVVRSFIAPSDRVLELGACLGVVSCITNKALTDKTRHVVVEANPFCLPSLHRNRDLNGCGFLIEHCAVSTSRDVTFHVNPKMIVSSSLGTKTDLPVRVPAKSLAELDARHGPFTALIMDIEGAELETLESAREVLRHYRLVILELHDWALGEAGLKRCRDLLGEAGLQCRKRVQWVEAWERI